MASVANNFAMLIGAGEQVSAGKKKKANKKAAPAPEAKPAPAAPSASAMADSMAALSVSSNVVVEVDEAKAIFERAAREAKSSGDKGRLWKDWTRQASPSPGPTCMQHGSGQVSSSQRPHGPVGAPVAPILASGCCKSL